MYPLYIYRLKYIKINLLIYNQEQYMGWSQSKKYKPLSILYIKDLNIKPVLVPT